MKRTISVLIITLLTATSGAAQVKLKHGLILGGGQGLISNAKYTVDDAFWEGTRAFKEGSVFYKYNAMIGYKFRLKPVDSKAFYDIDLNLTIKKIGYSTRSISIGEEQSPMYLNPTADLTTSCVSVAFSYNYTTRKGMYVGAGLEPLYRYSTSGISSYTEGEKITSSDMNKFDMPIFVKMGYDFKHFDLSVSFKKGITDMLEDKYVKNGKINDLQFQLFIPF